MMRLLLAIAVVIIAILLVIFGRADNQIRPQSAFRYGVRLPMLSEDGELCEQLFGQGWTPEIRDFRTRLLDPTISPDGNFKLITTGRFYYVSDNEVFLANIAESGEITQLTNNDFDENSAIWTPDGEWIVYSSFHDTGIYRMHRDGSDRVRIVKGFYETFDVSPDGQHIAFVERDFIEGATLWRAPMEGSSEPIPILTDILGYISSIVWSPDGTQIAFAEQSNGYDRAGLISAFPSSANDVQTVITLDQYDNMVSVRWSPDGEWLLLFVGLYSPDSGRYFAWHKARPNGDDFSMLPGCNIGICPLN